MSRYNGVGTSHYRLIALLAVLSVAFAAPALAGKPGGKASDPAATCTVSGNVVSAAGLPIGQLVNFLITDASGTSGWVLGYTSDGTWSVNVPAQNGATTYQFVSTTWGPNGSKYDVFGAC
jgi:hypothetical protein